VYCQQPEQLLTRCTLDALVWASRRCDDGCMKEGAQYVPGTLHKVPIDVQKMNRELPFGPQRIAVLAHDGKDLAG
jgi:hypothetical protein